VIEDEYGALVEW